MKVNNSNPKYISKPLKINNASTQLKPAHSQSFGSCGGAIVALMDSVDRGGLVASFLIQDFMGMNVPRSLTGLYRNREVTNQYNYQEAAEVALREFLSGPTMFAVPMLMLWGIKRMFGKANDIPANMIRALGENFAEYTAGKTASQLADSKKVKEVFYNDLFKNILKNTYKEGTSQDIIDQKALQFTNDLLEYESLKAQKKTKGFFDKVKGKRVPGTAEDKLADLIESYSQIKKLNSSNVSDNFLNAKISVNGKTETKNIGQLFADMRNFAEDISSSIAKRIKTGDFQGEELKQFVKKFTDFRTGSRVLTNLSMMAGIIGFCSVMPKIYQLSDKNPGLKGIETKELAKNEKAKENNAKPVAFGGAIDAIGKAATKKGFLGNLLNKFEFDGFNVSFTGFLTVCGLGILLPRLYHAREENEYKEVLFRDTTTIGTVACAAKILQQVFAQVCTKATGLALKIKPDNVKDTPLSKILSYMKPVNGHKVLTSDQLYSKYMNIHQYNGGAAGFARFIDEQGGNITKAFDVDKEAKATLKELYEKSAKAATTSFENAKNSDVIEALDDVIKNKKADDLLEKLYSVFKNEDNKFLKKAKIMNSSFNFAVLFFVVPVLLGFVIPRLNEILTKKRQMEKNSKIDEAAKTEVKQNSQKVEERKEKEPMTSTKIQSQSKAFKAFNEMLYVD